MANSKLAPNKVMALKGKSRPQPGALWLQLGAKRYQLPIEVLLLRGDGDLFLQIKPSSSIYAIMQGQRMLEAAEGSSHTEAYKRLMAQGRKPRSRAKRSVELDEATLALMRQVEAKLKSQGFKPIVDAKTGQIRASKPRVKRSQNS